MKSYLLFIVPVVLVVVGFLYWWPLAFVGVVFIAARMPVPGFLFGFALDFLWGEPNYLHIIPFPFATMALCTILLQKITSRFFFDKGPMLRL